MPLQLFTTLGIITAATSVVYTILISRSTLKRVYVHQKFFFECCLIRSTHLEVFFNEMWNHWKVFFWNSRSESFWEIPGKTSARELNEKWNHRRFSFEIAPLNIFGKFLEKHQQESSCSVKSFLYVPCWKWFSRNFPKIFRTAFSKNTASGMFLISSDYSFKISRTPFNP